MSQPANIKGALDLLGQVLQQTKTGGAKTVNISSESLSALEQLPVVLMKQRSGMVSAVQPQQVVQPQPAAQPKAAVQPSTAEPQNEPKPAAVEVAKPASVGPVAAPNPYGELAVRVEKRGRVELIHPAGESVRDRLNNLFRLAKKCEICRAMDTLWDQMVFATGDPEADLMFVGEAPGAEEELQKKPSVGPAGQKLDGIIKGMGLKREDVYISNIVKYRPKIGDGRFQGPKNRMPTPDEMAASVKYVRSEIEVIKPKVIVALGATAAEGLLDASGSVSSMRGKFYDLDGIPVMVTYHPSYLVRLEADGDRVRAMAEKRKVWEDILMTMERLGLPISEKQRGFFKQ